MTCLNISEQSAGTRINGVLNEIFQIGILTGHTLHWEPQANYFVIDLTAEGSLSSLKVNN